MFVIAGIFVGQIAQSSPIVLIEPDACGYIDVDKSLQTVEGRIGYQALNINISPVSQQYARSCYRYAGSISALKYGHQSYIYSRLRGLTI